MVGGRRLQIRSASGAEHGRRVRISAEIQICRSSAEQGKGVQISVVAQARGVPAPTWSFRIGQPRQKRRGWCVRRGRQSYRGWRLWTGRGD